MIITLNKFKNNSGGSGGGGDLVDFSLLGYNKQQTEDVLTMLKTDLQMAVDAANSWDPKTTSATYLFDDESFTYAPYIDTSNVTNMDYMFQGSSALKYIPKYDTSKVTNMGSMFYNCLSLITVPSLDTSNVTDMGRMFYYCQALKTIPLLDTSNVTNMNNMFYYCVKLNTVPLLDTSNVTDMNNMFYYCRSLETVPSLDTSNVTNTYSMFYGCASLKTVPSLDTSKATNMSQMFYSCSSLEEVNGIDFSSLTTAPSNLWGYSTLSKLKKIILNGKIDFSWNSYAFDYTPNIDYDSIMSILTAMSKTTNTNAKTMKFNSKTDSTNEITNLIDTCTSLGWTTTGLTLKYPDRVYTGKEFYEAGFIKPLNENILIEVEGDDIIISGWDKLPISPYGYEYHLNLYIASPVYWGTADISCKVDIPYVKNINHKIMVYDTLSGKSLNGTGEYNVTMSSLGSNTLLKIIYKATVNEDVSAGVRFTIHTITAKEVNPQPLSTINNAAHYYVTDSTTGTNIQNVEGLKLYNMYDLIYNDELGYYVCRVIDNEYDEDVYAYNYINRIGLSDMDANTVSVTYNGVAVPTTRQAGGNYDVTIDLAGINYNE